MTGRNNITISQITSLLSLVVLLVVIGLLWRQIRLDSWTYDERLHLQSASEWLKSKTTPSDPFNPPLAKLLALVPVAITGNTNVLRGYFLDPFLTIPRFAIVLVTILTSAVLGYFVTQRYSPIVGFWSIFFFALEPLVLAHGHLFTTDMVAILWFIVAYFAFIFWMKGAQPWWWITVIALSLLAVTKFTSLPIVVTSMVVAWQWQRRSWLLLLKKLLSWQNYILAIFIIWAAYGFAWYDPFSLGFKIPLGGWIETVARAGCFVACPKYQVTRNLIYFEEVSHVGWWSYPVIAFFIKTSLTVTITWLLLGTKYIRSELKVLLPPILSVLTWVTLARYNVGARHLLPALPWMAIATSLLLVNWWRKYPWGKFLAIFIVSLHLTTAFFTNDYLSYFNPLVGGKYGGKIMADSNLDWGQSLYRLSQAVQSGEIILSGNIYLTSMSPFSFWSLYGLNVKPLPPADNLQLSQLGGNTVIIGRTSWYLGKYYLHPKLSKMTPEYIVSDTLLLFRIP